MSTTVAKPRKWGWLVLDLVGGATLMLGVLAVFAPEAIAGIGVPAAWGWPLIVIGIVAMSAAMLSFFRQLRALRAG